MILRNRIFNTMFEYNEKGERFFHAQLFTDTIILYLWFIDIHFTLIKRKQVLKK